MSHGSRAGALDDEQELDEELDRERERVRERLRRVSGEASRSGLTGTRSGGTGRSRSALTLGSRGSAATGFAPARYPQAPHVSASSRAGAQFA